MKPGQRIEDAEMGTPSIVIGPSNALRIVVDCVSWLVFQVSNGTEHSRVLGRQLVYA
jgi:hypothetical protein